jgi:hypothetical protein
MVDLTSQDCASVNPGYWANTFKIQLQKALFTFTGREYQIEPMCSKARRICFMKATQGGFTEIEVLISLWGMIYNIYPAGVLYMFPTNDDVNDFSKSRFNPLILANRRTIGQYVRHTDTAGLKKIHNAFLYLRGARLSQKMSDDMKESSKLRGIPTDRLVLDEMDLMDMDVLTKGRQRMADSEVKQEVYISNPGVPDEGIDAVFQKSDQRYWHRKCLSCGEWTCAELSFPDCIKHRSDGTGYIGCNKCGKEVYIRDGQWVPSVPSNSDYMHGYNWSQLSSLKNDPAEILEEFVNPPENNLGDIIKLRLGKPYIAEEHRLTIQQVFACCGANISPHTYKGPCAMGVDVGKIKHVVIGIRTGNESYEILKTVQLSKWEDIHDIARRFNVKSAVIDIRPYEDEARRFQAAEKYRIYLCEYKENTPHGIIYNNKTGIVAVNRTEIFDSTHNLIATPGMLRLPRQCPEVKEFGKQVCAAYKILEKNKRTNTSVYRYKGKEEHFRNALNYFLLAAQGGKIATVNKYRRNIRQRNADNNYKRI